MIGIIVWALLIIFIAVSVCPGFLTAFFCIGLPVFALFYYINEKLSDKFK